MIRVAVAGAAGRMGETVCAAVEGAEDMQLVGRPIHCWRSAWPTCSPTVTPPSRSSSTSPSPKRRLETRLACIEAGVHVVLGTTGFDLDALREAAFAQGEPRANVLVAPNFAIGAVLMMRFATEAAKHMAKAEIIELHHDRKLDAPSGTAARTAELMAGASGQEAPPIHSVRLPGLVANQEVILGDLAQTLDDSPRHDWAGVVHAGRAARRAQRRDAARAARRRA